MNARLDIHTVPLCHVVKGQTMRGADLEFGPSNARFTTPRLDLDQLVWLRAEPGPAFDTPLAEIMDILVATGAWLKADPKGWVAEALEFTVKTSPLPRDVLERSYASLGRLFARQSMEFQVQQELGGADVLDSWREIDTPAGRHVRIRAFPPRLIHIIAGNAPGVAAMTIVRGALTKGVHLIKIPSNDLFTATAILRGLAEVAPGHPLSRSFSAVYWRGGDENVEGRLFLPQFFDKLVAWGGESTIRTAQKYIGPGFELVSFDPKTSISMLGHEIFSSPGMLADAAERGSIDATVMNQQACVSSRIQFVEGSTDEVDRYCEALQPRLGLQRETASTTGRPVPSDLRDEVDGLRDMEPYYRVWGKYDGSGLVIRSEAPVDFQPDGKMVNVVPVKRLEDAIRYVNIATQTIGVFPQERKLTLRNALAAAGAQRVVTLGTAGVMEAGLPHDGFLPLSRFVRWVNDE
ncbi:MAG: hypothetical protein QOG17_1727 [Gammaproteobacteria bacterium]|jgi:hypothetical protein|nr:hypothetical protein [Gammaproteobacteria bacterium]